MRVRGSALKEVPSALGQSAMEVTVVGLGILGAAVARKLAKEGFVVTAWSRSEGSREKVQGDGVQVSLLVCARGPYQYLMTCLMRGAEVSHQLFCSVQGSECAAQAIRTCWFRLCRYLTVQLRQSGSHPSQSFCSPTTQQSMNLFSQSLLPPTCKAKQYGHHFALPPLPCIFC